MKKAAAYKIDDRIFMQSFSQTDDGFWILAGPVWVLDAGDEAALAAGIIDALAESKSLPRASIDWKAVQNPMLASTRSKSWAALARRSLAVGIEDAGRGAVVFTATANHADKGGCVVEPPVETTSRSADLGRALLEAFEACS